MKWIFVYFFCFFSFLEAEIFANNGFLEGANPLFAKVPQEQIQEQKAPLEIQEEPGFAENQIKPPSTKEELEKELNVPTSGAYEVEQAWDFYNWISFLYWQPKQDGVEAGKVFLTSNAPGRVLKQDFDFVPAFKIGLGMHFNYDDWIACLEYLRIVSSDRTIYTIEKDTTFQSFWMQTPRNDIEKVSSDWKIRFHLLNAMKARPFYVGEKVILQPSYGIGLFWLQQKWKEALVKGLSYRFHGLCHSWAFGLRGSVNTQWMLEQGFRIFAHVAASLFYQRFHARASFDDLSLPSPGFTAFYSLQQEGRINPSVEASTGCGWGKYFLDHRFHMDFIISYDFYYFWHQNELLNMVQDFQNNTRAASEGLSLQGMTVTARLDY